MILTCPSCSAQFLVDAALIPPEGREVRCAKCAHQWFYRPQADVGELTPPPEPEDVIAGEAEEADSAEDLDTQAEPLPDELPDMPAIHFGGDEDDSGGESGGAGKKSLKPLLALAFVLLLGVLATGFLAFRATLQPHLGFAYDLVGLYATDGLALADIELRERPSRSKARFVVEGKIINEAAEPRRIPMLRVSIIDKDGNVMASREYEADDADNLLQPGETYPFKASNLETAFKDKVDHLVVDIGHGTELMLRSLD